MNWLLAVLLLSIPLGQLTRIELAKGINLYLHDFAVLLIALWLLKNIKKLKSLWSLKFSRAMFIFFFTCLLSLLFALRNYKVWEIASGGLYLLRWVAYTGICYFLILRKRSVKKLKIANRNYDYLDLLLLSGVSFACIGLVQYFLIPDLRDLKWLGWDDHYYRLIATLFDPAFTGIMLVLTLLLALCFKQQLTIKSLSITICFTAMLLTYSRASYLAFISGLITLFWLSGKRIAIVLIPVFFSLLLFLPKAESEGTNLLRVYSVIDRLSSWKQALIINRDNPLFGIGFNLTKYAKLRHGFTDNNWQSSHSDSGFENSFLFVLATTGIIGLVAFLNLIFTVGKITQYNPQTMHNLRNCVTASAIAVSVHALFNNTWFYPWVMLWMWFLVGDYLSNYSSK